LIISYGFYKQYNSQVKVKTGWLTDLENENPAYVINLMNFFPAEMW